MEENQDQNLDLVVAGTNDGVLMVESEAKELDEKTMLGAVDFGHKELKNHLKVLQKVRGIIKYIHKKSIEWGLDCS